MPYSKIQTKIQTVIKRNLPFRQRQPAMAPSIVVPDLRIDPYRAHHPAPGSNPDEHGAFQCRDNGNGPERRSPPPYCSPTRSGPVSPSDDGLPEVALCINKTLPRDPRLVSAVELRERNTLCNIKGKVESDPSSKSPQSSSRVNQPPPIDITRARHALQSPVPTEVVTSLASPINL